MNAKFEHEMIKFPASSLAAKSRRSIMKWCTGSACFSGPDCDLDSRKFNFDEALFAEFGRFPALEEP
jgi:hypothetical protein